MTEDLKKLIESDVYRHYAGEKKPFLWKLHNVALYYQIIHRKAHYYSSQNQRVVDKLKGLWYRYQLNRLSRKYLLQIPFSVSFGKGLNIVHFGRIIIAPTVIIGDNCNVFTGVTIGSTVRGKRAGVPKIGNSVWIGPNAAIVGKIEIGNNVLIAANSYVNFDVPSNSIVLGNPGKIIHKDRATDGYICQKV